MALRTDPFLTSIMARSAVMRVLAIVIVLAALWASIGWAVALP